MVQNILYLHVTRTLDKSFKKRRDNNLRANYHCVSLKFLYIIEKSKKTKETSIRKDRINEDLVTFSNTGVARSRFHLPRQLSIKYSL